MPYRLIVLDTADDEFKQVVREAPPIPYSFVAGENLQAYKCVYLSGNNTVKQTDGIVDHSMRCIGITIEAKNLGETIGVVTSGKILATAFGPIVAGDPIVATIDGKVNFYLSHSHNIGPPTYETDAVKGLTSPTGSSGSHSHAVGGFTGTLYSGAYGTTHTHQAGNYLLTNTENSHSHTLSNLSKFTAVSSIPSVTGITFHGLVIGKAINTATVAGQQISVLMR